MKNKNIRLVWAILLFTIGVLVIVTVLLTTKEVYDKNVPSKDQTTTKVESKDIIEIIQNNSELPIKYMTKYDDINPDILKDYKPFYNYMDNSYTNDDIIIDFYGYPNDESDFYFASFTLTSNKYSIFNIHVGDDYDKALAIINNYGFITDSETNNLVKDKIRIDIDQENNKVKLIKVSAASEYLGNRVY